MLRGEERPVSLSPPCHCCGEKELEMKVCVGGVQPRAVWGEKEWCNAEQAVHLAEEAAGLHILAGVFKGGCNKAK